MGNRNSILTYKFQRRFFMFYSVRNSQCTCGAGCTCGGNWACWLREMEKWTDDSNWQYWTTNHTKTMNDLTDRMGDQDMDFEWVSCIKGPCGKLKEHMDVDTMVFMLSVVGFEKNWLNLSVKDGVLMLKAKGGTFLTEEIDYSYRLAEHVEVDHTVVMDGVLMINLVKKLPEEEKPVEIDIN